MRLQRASLVLDFALRVLILVCAFALFTLIGATLGAVAHAQTIPAQAQAYKLTLKREAQRVWGLDAPVATFAAQVHQESRWRSDARSPVGALGLTQFMPSTAVFIGRVDASLSSQDASIALNPRWALRALVTYDFWLWERVQAADYCSRMAFALSGYNGGLGWVYRDQHLASSMGLDKQVWWASVETVNAGRTSAAWTENKAYPRKILTQLTLLYVSAGWGRGVCQ